MYELVWLVDQQKTKYLQFLASIPFIFLSVMLLLARVQIHDFSVIAALTWNIAFARRKTDSILWKCFIFPHKK